MFENFWKKAEEFTKDERGAVATERIEPGKYSVGKAVELLKSDAEVAEAVRAYNEARFQIAAGGHHAEDADYISAAEEKLLRGLEKRGVELERVNSSAGFDDTLSTFATSFEQMKKEQPQEAESGEVVQLPGQQPEAGTADEDRREAA